MRTVFFHLMPYKGLPENFADEYESVWVNIPRDLWDAELAGRLYHEYLDQLVFADELGFDGVGVNEHHANGYGLMSTPQMMAAVLARETKNAAIMILGASAALYDPPQRIAEDMATVDVMSKGRLIAGFPVGTPFDTCFAYSQNPSSVREKYREAVEIALRCWEGKDIFAFNGEHYQQQIVNTFIQPIQDPRPPIWVPGGGAIETWEWAAQKDFCYTYTSQFGFGDAELQTKGFWDAVAAAGRDRNPFRLGVMQYIGIADSKEEATEMYREPAEFFWNDSMNISPRFFNAPGYMTEATLRHKFNSARQKAAMAEHANILAKKGTMEEGIAKRHIAIGTPDEVAEQLREACVTLNAGHLIALPQYGNMSDELARYNIERFAREVKPQIDDLWEDEWEDHWWPQNAKQVPPPPVADPKEAVR